MRCDPSLALAASMLAATATGAQQRPAPAPSVSADVVMTAPPRQASVALSGGATMLPAVAYEQPPGYQPVTLDLYTPSPAVRRPAGGFPLVIYIHGGAWLGGDPRKSGAFTDWPAVLGGLAQRGYVVASLSYRLSGEARFPAPAIDVRTAIRWLKHHAADYRLDPAKVVVWGASAGGHLAGVAATGCHVAAFDPPPPRAMPGGPPARPDPLAGISPCVQGMVTWYGVFDLATIADQSRTGGVPGASDHSAPQAAEWMLLGCTPATCRNGEVALASPVTHVGPDSPPSLIIAGSVDRTVPVQQSEEMASALRTAGVRTRLMIYPGIDHSFIGRTPADTRRASLDALAATFAFIDETIGGGR